MLQREMLQTFMNKDILREIIEDIQDIWRTLGLDSEGNYLKKVLNEGLDLEKGKKSCKWKG